MPGTIPSVQDMKGRLRSSALPDGSIEKALGDVCDDFASGGTTRRLRIFILGKTRPLEPAVHEQIYWIAREALLNALRHSKASRVEAEIEYLPRKLRVMIRDNGTGVDPEALRIKGSSHLGLIAMQERAASISAKVRIWTKRRKGTEVAISLPITGAGKSEVDSR